MSVSEDKSYPRKHFLTIVFAAILLSSFGMLAHNAFAHQVVAAIALDATDAMPQFVGVNPSTNMIYVGQNGGNAIYVIDGSTNTLVNTLTVGSNDADGIPTSPSNIAANPVTNMIYVDTRNDGLVVVDGASNSVVTTIPAGEMLEGVGVNSQTNKIYVGNAQQRTVTVIDGATNTIKSTIPVASDPIDVAVNPETNMVYVANFHSNLVTVIDGETDSVIGSILVGVHPYSIGINPDTKRIYVSTAGTAFRDPNMYVIDGLTNIVISVIPQIVSTQVGVNPTTNKIYVPNYDNDLVDVIDGTTNSVVHTVTVGDGPQAAGANPSTNMIYVVNSNSKTISVIDGNTDSVIPANPIPIPISILPRP